VAGNKATGGGYVGIMGGTYGSGDGPYTITKDNSSQVTFFNLGDVTFANTVFVNGDNTYWLAQEGKGDGMFYQSNLSISGGTNVTVDGGHAKAGSIKGNTVNPTYKNVEIGPNCCAGDGFLLNFVTGDTLPTGVVIDNVDIHDIAELCAEYPGAQEGIGPAPCVDNAGEAHVDCFQATGAIGLTIQNSTAYSCATQGWFLGGSASNLPANSPCVSRDALATHGCYSGDIIFRNLAYTKKVRNQAGGVGLGMGRAGTSGTVCGVDPSFDEGSTVSIEYNSSNFVTRFDWTCYPPSSASLTGNLTDLCRWNTCGAPACDPWPGVMTVTHRFNVYAGKTCGATDTQGAASLDAYFVDNDLFSPDLHLVSGALPIDKGDLTNYPATDAEGSARYIGAAPDAGAYEFGGTPSPPPPPPPPPPPAPVISSFSPTSGPVATAVTLTGTDFTGASSVKFNGTTASYTVTDSTHIATTVPSAATTGTIAVVAPGGTGTSSSSFTVTVSPPPPPPPPPGGAGGSTATCSPSPCTPGTLGSANLKVFSVFNDSVTPPVTGNRTYGLYRPSGLTNAANNKVPAVIAFKAAGGGSTEISSLETNSGWDPIADANKFVVAYAKKRTNPTNSQFLTPDISTSSGCGDVNCLGPTDSDEPYVRDMIAHLIANENVDPLKIYVAGQSAGGGMVENIACDTRFGDTYRVHGIGNITITMIAAGISAPHIPNCPLNVGSHADPPWSFMTVCGTDDGNVRPVGCTEPGTTTPNGSNWSLSQVELIDFFRPMIGCSSTVSTVNIGSPSINVQKTWDGCNGGQAMRYVKVENGLHQWYRGQPEWSGFYTASELWDFWIANYTP
jgi:poly(3-hydroxybutyrate) depolymerase